MSRRDPKDSNDGWIPMTETAIDNKGRMKCRPPSHAEGGSNVPASSENRLMTEGCDKIDFVTNETPGTIGTHRVSSHNRSPVLQHPSMSSTSASRNIIIDPQTFWPEPKGQPYKKMESKHQNYVVASPSVGNQPVSRSAIPRTAYEPDASFLLNNFPNVLESLSNSKITEWVDRTHRYGDQAYSQEISTMRRETQSIETPASKQPRRSSPQQNAYIAENRQQNTRSAVQDAKDKKEGDDQDNSSSEDTGTPGFRQY